MRLKSLYFLKFPQCIPYENKVKSFEIEKIKEKIGFFNMIAVDYIGEGRERSGGLAVFWGDTL